MQKYFLEFILNVQDVTPEALKNSLMEFGEDLHICNYCGQDSSGENFKVNISTEEPTVIFDICAQFGRISQVKINEEGG